MEVIRLVKFHSYSETADELPVRKVPISKDHHSIEVWNKPAILKRKNNPQCSRHSQLQPTKKFNLIILCNVMPAECAY